MNEKLTLRVDASLIRDAKRYAKKEGKSVSKIVSEYFKAISAKPGNFKGTKLRPITSKLYGSLKGSSISKEDYRRRLENKYL